jgi:hypothetical protein
LAPSNNGRFMVARRAEDFEHPAAEIEEDGTLGPIRETEIRPHGLFCAAGELWIRGQVVAVPVCARRSAPTLLLLPGIASESTVAR